MATGATYINGLTGNVEGEDLVSALGGPEEVADAANVATVVTALKALGLFVDPA